MRILRCALVALSIGFLLVPQAVAADDIELEYADDDEWNERWPRFRWWEGVATVALAAEAFTVRFALELDQRSTVTGGLLFDDRVYEALNPRNDDVYHAWVFAGDVPFYASIAWPLLDPLSVAAATGDWDAPTQMLLMNMESYSFLAAALWTTQHFVRRERPHSTDLCADDPQRASDREVSCGPERNRAFLGGHTAVVVMNASLTCLHHTQMDLYGDAGDALVCGTWIAAAGVTFASRTVTGKHYLTDNIFGTGLGLVSGLAIPYLLHYAHDHMLVEDLEDPAPQPDGPQVVGVSLQPDFGERGLELSVHGTL
jgi:hypothetical protein